MLLAAYCGRMSEVPHSTAGDEGGLGALLALLDGAADSFWTVQGIYRTWRHEQRRWEAFRSRHAEQVRRGVSTNIVASAARSSGPGPVETHETLRVWREGRRVRLEVHGGLRDGSYGVVDGPLWWSWSEQLGASSNHHDASVRGGVGREFQFLFDPRSLLDVLDFQVAGHSQVAGRETVTAYATPCEIRDLRNVVDGLRDLHALGMGADRYQFEVDQERGVLLAATAIHNKQPFFTITTLAIRFDERIAAETFQFKTPAGEPILSPREQVPARPRLVTLTEARQRASFTVLVPDHLPAGLRQVHAMFHQASPWAPEHLALNYRSDDGRQNMSIYQMAAEDASSHYGTVFDDDSWYEAFRGGTKIKIRPAGEWHPAQAVITRHRTYARLSSHSVAADELATIAASLRPAPKTGSD